MNNGFFGFPTYGISNLKSTSSYATLNSNTFVGNQIISGSVSITGSLIMNPTSSFILPLSRSLSPQIGSAYWSGSFLFIYNGTRYMSSSFA